MQEKTLNVHLPCNDCGSSDALTEYVDGYYCFSCNKSTPKTNTPSKSIKTNKALIPFENLELKSLVKRGITQSTCQKYNYYTTIFNDKSCQVANYYDTKGTLVAQKLRFPDKTFAILGKMANTFYGQHLFNGGRKLVITEGEIDALTVSQINGNKYPCVSIPTGATSASKIFKEQLEWLNTFEEVIVMFDNDEAGRKATESVCKILPHGKLKIASLPLKDANECLLAGKAEDVIKAIFNARPYRPDGIVNGCELWEELNKSTDAEKGYTFPTGCEKLYDMTQGIRKGELFLVTAGTGIGKTTFVRQLAYHLGTNLHLKVGMMMLEENVKRTAKGLLAVHVGKRLAINKDLVSPTEFKQAYDEVLAKGNYVFYQHFGSLESDNLLSKMRYLAVSEMVDFIILDHITIAISGLDIDNERKATDVLMTNLRSLCEETGVGMVVISHLKRVDGKPAEEGGIVSLSHLRGSQALAQLSDTILALERDLQDKDSYNRNVINLRVLKNRLIGETGSAGQLKYNADTDRLEQIEYFDNTNDDRTKVRSEF